MTNVGLWSGHSNWFTHELEHNAHIAAETSDAGYAAMHEQETSNSASSAVAVEHELLHAANHLQLFLGVTRNTAFLPAAHSVRFCFARPVLPCATYDAPFRPPRFSTSLS